MKIESYNYSIDQRTTDLGLFIQSDWTLSGSINFSFRSANGLSTILINGPGFLVRAILYSTNTKQTHSFRFNYGTGF